MLLSSKLPGLGTTIFTRMSRLATEHGAINLSQGFPDFDCAPQLLEHLNEALRGGKNQYAPMAGVLELREAISHKQEMTQAAYFDPETEITITAGGTQAIFTVLTTVIRPGDEVIIFEPAYDSYSPSVEVLGGKCIAVETHPDQFRIDWAGVRSVITTKTRMIILNSPNNPSGALLQESDLEELIALTRDTNILILSDEVYEHITFEGVRHLSVSAYPELRERSFVCASFGKLFHTTGWKVGYCLAPAELSAEFRKLHQFMVFSVNSPAQYAIAKMLADPSCYLELSSFFQKKRDIFRDLMQQTRFELLPCPGSYFQLARFRHISGEEDTVFAERMTKEHGVASIPVSAFYRSGTDHGLLRFCFAKRQETLEKAVERLVNV